MTQATEKTLQNYRANIKFGQERTLPAGQGLAIKGVIEEYKIPAIAWGYYGSLIGVETKKQIMIWRDKGTHLEFKGLINKEDNSSFTPKNSEKPNKKIQMSREKYEYMLGVLPPLILGKKEIILFLKKHDNSPKLAKSLESPQITGAFMQGEGLDNHEIYVKTSSNKFYMIGKTRESWDTQLFRYADWKSMTKEEIDRF